ncbi:hypothetical protein IWQ60_010107 [Tieghemiomyces parasiticus]|uniref:Translocation protein sec72 n=1 Tax=Tieghemiomyces parasiticus TaxID=78921 RepID=A0A9W7ZKS1_9FUNG|nr:hypothetical protein IWQ60_010107 [Tieghemiomyces parasiticus]
MSSDSRPSTPTSTASQQVQPAAAPSSSTGKGIPLGDNLLLVNDLLVCATHRQQHCEPCDVDFRDQNLMTKNLEANQGRLPPPHPQMGQAVHQLKTDGNTAYRAKEYEVALKKYSDALRISQQRPVWDPAGLIVEELSVLLNNRAACLLELDQPRAALADAEIVTRIKHTWAKGHFRKGRALYGLHRYREAAHAFELGVALDNEAAEMKSYLKKTLQLV